MRRPPAARAARARGLQETPGDTTRVCPDWGPALINTFSALTGRAPRCTAQSRSPLISATPRQKCMCPGSDQPTLAPDGAHPYSIASAYFGSSCNFQYRVGGPTRSPNTHRVAFRHARHAEVAVHQRVSARRRQTAIDVVLLCDQEVPRVRMQRLVAPDPIPVEPGARYVRSRP